MNGDIRRLLFLLLVVDRVVVNGPYMRVVKVVLVVQVVTVKVLLMVSGRCLLGSLVLPLVCRGDLVRCRFRGERVVVEVVSFGVGQ